MLKKVLMVYVGIFILLQHILNEKRRHTIDDSKNSTCWIQKYICIPCFHSIGGRIH